MLDFDLMGEPRMTPATLEAVKELATDVCGRTLTTPCRQ